jgi:hypothetical protein
VNYSSKYTRLIANKTAVNWELSNTRPTTCSICLNLDDHFRRRDARLTFRQLKESAREGCERCSLLRDGVEICVPASKISDFGCLESARGEGRERGWTHMVWVPENGWHSDRIEFELFTLPGEFLGLRCN